MHKEYKILNFLIYLIGIFPFFKVAFVPRSWGASLFSFSTKYIDIVYFILILLLSLLCLKDILKKNFLLKEQIFLSLGIILLYIGPLISTVLAYKPYFDVIMIVNFIVLFSVTVKNYQTVDSKKIFLSIERISLFYIYGSLLAIVLNFNWAVQQPYPNSITGLNIRLYGLANHPNNLSAMAFLYLILCYIERTKSKIMLFHLIATLFVILLAQSKTVMIITLFVLISISIFKITSVNGRRKFLSLGFLTLFFSFFIWLIYVNINFIYSKINSGELGDFDTFTGRSIIWEYTVKYWSLNKLFGYGNDLWNEQMQNGFRLFTNGNYAPFHSHNQFYQTLGTSGIMGVIGLSLFGMIIIYSINKIKGRNKFGLILFALAIFIRGFTEPVFSNELNDLNIFITLSFLLSILLFLKEDYGGSNNVIN